MRIFMIIFAALLAVSSSTFAFTGKPTVHKVNEYKIHRVEGSKMMSNFSNESTSTKLPVIVTFNSIKEAHVSNIASTRKYKHIPSVAATMTMAEVHELAKRADVKQIEYDETVANQLTLFDPLVCNSPMGERAIPRFALCIGSLGWSPVYSREYRSHTGSDRHYLLIRIPVQD